MDPIMTENPEGQGHLSGGEDHQGHEGQKEGDDPSLETMSLPASPSMIRVSGLVRLVLDIR